MHDTSTVISAVQDNDIESLRQLLEAGASPDAQDEKGATAVMIAATEKKMQVLQMLIDAGADLDARWDDNNTAVTLTVVSNNLEPLRLLLNAGADPNIFSHGLPLLTFALKPGWEEVLQCLIQAGANLNAKSERGGRPIIAAASEGRMQSLRILIEAGADLNAQDEIGYTAAISAVLLNQLETLQVLIEAGADLNIQDEEGYAALFYATAAENAEAVRLLVNAKADLAGKGLDLNEVERLYKAASREYMRNLLKTSDQQKAPKLSGKSMNRGEMRDVLLAQYGLKCQGCDRVFDDPRYLELDHNTPRSDGGLDHISNRILLCGPCNRAKSNQYTLSGLRRLNKKNGWMVES